jgi:hypothetical protein
MSSSTAVVDMLSNYGVWPQMIALALIFASILTLMMAFIQRDKKFNCRNCNAKCDGKLWCYQAGDSLKDKFCFCSNWCYMKYSEDILLGVRKL